MAYSGIKKTLIKSDLKNSQIGTTAYIEFANGITTTNTYDPNELYRLTSKITTDGVDDLQDISYTFDAVGNITAIADDSDTDRRLRL